MEWWGGSYQDYMNIPATRRRRFVEWKMAREKKLAEAKNPK